MPIMRYQSRLHDTIAILKLIFIFSCADHCLYYCGTWCNRDTMHVAVDDKQRSNIDRNDPIILVMCLPGSNCI